MKVMGRCKGDFWLEIHNFTVLIAVTKYNNCFFLSNKRESLANNVESICMGLNAEVFANKFFQLLEQNGLPY